MSSFYTFRFSKPWLAGCALAVAALCLLFVSGCASGGAEGGSAAASTAAFAGAPTPPPAPEKTLVAHKVVTGDTLWDLSMAYRTSVKEIKEANQLTSDLIVEGQTLNIPTMHPPAAPAAAVPGAAAAPATAPAAAP
ncbi:MAG: LysM peptidoglycan-binding domain-containing protein, partial [Verrucomicrobiales bacterium]